MGASVRVAVAGVVVALVAAASADARAASDVRTVAGMYTGAGRALPIVSSSIDVHVDGPFAEATVTQRFKNPLDQPIEAVYIFPLPDDASVSAMVIHAGTRTITARVEDRAAARARYEAAVAAGASGALLEEERPDVFTQQVTAIPPGAEVSVELRFDTTIARRAGVWELALPLVVAPREVPGAATGAPSAGTGGSPDTTRAPDASRVTPERGRDGTPFAIRARIDQGAEIDSLEVPTHDATVSLHGRRADVAIDDARGDHDVEIRWRTRGDALTAITDAAGFVAVIVPSPVAIASPPRDWIVVADTSKRLSGDGIILVRRAARALLDRLGPHDRVAIYDAGGQAQVALGGGKAIARARAWTDAIAAAGAGDLSRGLAAARAAAKDARRPVIVLVSDGLVADDAELYGAAAGGPPVLAVGVGTSPNRGLLDGLAARTGGAARYLGPADDPVATLDALVAQADTPRPAAVSIAWGKLVTDAFPATVPALAPGDAAVVIAKVDRPRQARVAVAARALDLPAVWSDQPARDEDVAKASVIARRWARAKLDALVASGAPATDVRALGLRYGLVTSETALVAVGSDTVVKGGVTTSVSVPVAMPAGMTWTWHAPEPAKPDLHEEAKKSDEKPGQPGHKEAEHDADKTAEKDERKNTGADNGETATAQTPPAAPPPVTTGESTIVTDSTTNAPPAAPTAPTETPETIQVTGRVAAAETFDEDVLMAGSMEVVAPRWSASLTLGAGALLAPSRDALGLASARLAHGLGWSRFALGVDLTVLGAPTADRDRLAVALMGALVRGGLFGGRLSFDVSVGPELASDPGLGYELGARFGRRRAGLVLRYDGAVLFGDKTIQRGSATAGVQVDF